MLLFYDLNSSVRGKQSKKILSNRTEFYGYQYELSIHLVCFNNSYYPNVHAALCCVGVCCNSPLLGRKGVSYDEVF